MSLDFYVIIPEQMYYIRENGSTINIPSPDCNYEILHVGNITHNLNEMAKHVPVSDTLTLYNILWRPDESDLKITDDILEYVAIGVKYLIDHKKELLKYNPDNGWGDYENLLDFSKHVVSACLFHPHCKIEVSR